MSKDKVFAKLDFDWSEEAQRQHKRDVSHMDYMERCGVKVSLSEVAKNRHKIASKIAARLLLNVFSADTRVERRLSWKEFKEFIIKNRIAVDFAMLKRIANKWNKWNTWKNKQPTNLQEVS